MKLGTILTLLRQAVALLAASAALAGTAAHAQASVPSATLTAADSALLDMNLAYRKGDQPKLAALLPQTRGHPLEPLAAYWVLKLRLDTAQPQEVREFLARYAGTYYEDRLRNDWLLLLGQRRDWDSFIAEHPSFRMGDDREVRCYALAIDFLRHGVDGSAEVRRLWHSQRDADDGCAFAAERFYAAGKLTSADIWKKARLAIEANRARAARTAVEIDAPELSAQVTDIQSNPSRYLASRISAAGKKRQELALLALIKIAAIDPEAAATELSNRWETQLTVEQRNWAWGVIGKQAALKLSDAAPRYFANVSRPQDLSDDMLAWLARAALRASQWKTVLAATAAMSDDAAADPTWVYWRARALLADLGGPEKRTAALLAAPYAPPRTPQTGAVGPSADGTEDDTSGSPAPAATATGSRAGTMTGAGMSAMAGMLGMGGKAARTAASQAARAAEARQLLEAIASTKGFYEMLALEELGRSITVPEPPAPITASEKQAARNHHGLYRALYAFAIGLRPEAVREWNYSTNLHTPGGMNDRQLLAAADWACERQVWDRCINTSERTRSFMDYSQRFPMPFRDTVVRQAGSIGLDPAYVYGLIRQESRFIMDARSGAGASGLMQVMPATARWTARKIGLQGFTPSQLSQRDTNILIGTSYLKLALDDFGGSMPMAAAAYNAGPNRPRAWRSGPVLEAAIWAENVPFGETRDYVKKVLANTTNYAAVLSGQPQSLRNRLGSVGPRTDTAAPENRDLP